MSNLILEVGILFAVNIANTYWTDKQSHQAPYLLVEKSVYENFYLKSLNSSRTSWGNIDTANPKTMLWTVEAGYRANLEDNGLLTISAGHTSEHEVNAVDKRTESFNYVNVSYRLEYK